MNAEPRFPASPLDGEELPALDAWRSAVERDLRGASFEARLVAQTAEQIAVQPLYTADATAAPPLPARAERAWRICQRSTLVDPARAAAALAADAAAGDGVWLALDRGTRLGVAAADATAAGRCAGDGLLVLGLEDLAQALQGVDLARCSVFLESGGNGLPLAALLVQLAAERGLSPDRLRGGLGADPLGALARDGALPAALDCCWAQLADLAGWTAQRAPGLRSVLVASEPYADAGAHAVQQLGCALATAVEYLRQLTARGLAVQAACDQLYFSFAVGRDLYMELAKLRAARLLWQRLAEACGAAGSAASICARSAGRAQTRRDPWGNLLRGTAACFAAAAGGADVVAVAAHDEAGGEPEELGRRLARNAQLILRHESHLGRTADPAAGSFYLEALTAALAEQGWAAMQRIEAAGGMRQALFSGAIADELAAARQAAAQDVAHGRLPITGVSCYALPEEPRVVRAQPDPAALLAARAAGPQPTAAELPALREAAATGRGQTAAALALLGATPQLPLAALGAALAGAAPPAAIAPLPRFREAAGFEALRDEADRIAAQLGHRPRLLLATVGRPRDFRGRADFARAFLEAGGLVALEPGALRDAEAAAQTCAAVGADGAVICAGDEQLPELVPKLAPLLRQAGARVVLLAGRPPDELARRYEQAGVELTIHRGSDRLAALRALQRAIGGGR